MRGLLACVIGTALSTCAAIERVCEMQAVGSAAALVPRLWRTDTSSLEVAVLAYAALADVALILLTARQLDLIGRGTTEHAERRRLRLGRPPSPRRWGPWWRNNWAVLTRGAEPVPHVSEEGNPDTCARGGSAEREGLVG